MKQFLILAILVVFLPGCTNGSAYRAYDGEVRSTMQIATLEGRSSALRLASEEDSVAGKTWNIRDVRRFTASAQGPADFCNDSLILLALSKV